MTNSLTPALASLIREISLKPKNEESEETLKNILVKSPKVFVENYWKYMLTTHMVELRAKINDDLFFTLYSRKIRNNVCKDIIDQRNRRYVAMKEMIHEGDFFSLGGMKTRNPVLYEELVGQYLSNEDVGSLARREYNKYESASQMLLGQIDNVRTSELYYEMIEREGEAGRSICEEELEDADASLEQNASQIHSNEKEMLEREFVTQMEHKFITGDDDALVVISDAKDLNSVADQDFEDNYFDSEVPPEPAVKTDTDSDDEYMTMDLSTL